MHISKSDGKTIEMSIDDLTYINSDDLDGKSLGVLCRSL